MRLFFIIICAIFLLALPLISKAVVIPDPFGGKSIPEIIDNIAEAMKTIAIVLGSVMIIVSGIIYMTSGGNEERATQAKKTMLYTVIGVAIVFAFKFIVEIVKAILK